MEEKKFQSIVRRVVLLPMTVMAAIVCITIISCIIGFFNMRQQMIDSNLSSLQVSQNQLENLLNQIDHAFIEYWNSNESYAYLKGYDRNTPKETYLVYESDAGTWLNNLVNEYEDIQGGFVCFENIGSFLFRGTVKGDAKVQVNEYIRSEEEKGWNRCNHWELVKVEEGQYLINIKNYQQFYGGIWIPVENLTRSLHLDEEGYRGTVYIRDSNGQNSLENKELCGMIQEQGEDKLRLSVGDETFYNYFAAGGQEDITLGILIPQNSMFTEIPLLNKGLFLLALLSILTIPVVTLWLRRKVALPVRAIDEAMQFIGEGNMDYRIPLPNKKGYDEFDRLMVRVNQTIDELNELEFKLYKRKIWEQQTELRYISQQIRPHFILNALNIIYTYEESEFPLVKKMVLYLTEYFRYIVNLKVDFVEVEQELHHVENYLKIQKERYLDRFEYFVEWEVGVQHLPLPPLIIQTFVENCIKYGMRGEGKTFIYVLASLEGEHLKLMIADTGNGFSQEVMDKVRTFIDTRIHQEGLGVGIQNAFERLYILYGEGVEVKLRNALSGGAVVELYLPIEQSEDEEEQEDTDV
ncbi:MAG: histidine kinase [Lachnospiraceae bacterium]|nr:histidine kinase [Lachnospiraceae bacterium]